MDSCQKHVLVCGGGGCLSSGCEEIKNTLLEELARWGLDKEIKVTVTGCMGPCSLGPMLQVQPEGRLFQRLEPEDVREIVEQYLYLGKREMEPEERDEGLVEANPFFKQQVKVALRNVGVIDPEDIGQYLARDGYQALAKVLQEMEPGSIVRTIKESGLRGRGGGGFPTGSKWEMAAQNPRQPKYLICNADEGDPGAFMDRSIIEGDPHSLIEGMIIGGLAIGASQGYVYLRAEYPLALERLRKALDQARERGYLGKNILNSGKDFDIEIRVGAGAFVCGEETALIHSIEGKRGEPSPRPPFPVEQGLWGSPTVINNVETLANIAPIILKGADWFRSLGTEKSPGTKVFALAGSIEKSGLVEVPMGTTLGQIIFEIGGGIPGGKRFKAAQTGGPSGGCIPLEHLNVSMDFDELSKLGTIMGSGGLIVLDEDTCMVNLAKFFLEFVQEESCGKCVPCRVGTKRMLEILERISRGEGREGDLERLTRLGLHIKDTALCGLGQTAPNPVLSTIRYFRYEYEEHISNKHCAASVCAALFVSPCQNACPAGVDVPRYIEAIQRKDYYEAVEIIREDNPFPSVCGRVCSHPCERRCQRAQLDEPIGIRHLKRFVGDYDLEGWNESMEHVRKAMEQVKATGKKVAVVGSGPAGLTAAYYLAKWGYQVKMFEEQGVLGGMLATAIPPYRLPKEALQKEIDWILSHGVEVQLNTRIGRDIPLSTLTAEYDAVFLAIGCQKDIPLNIPGEELPEVYSSLRFMKDLLQGKEIRIGQKVAVIGGGESAIDAARVARRLGAKEVSIIYRREKEDMPADPEEILETEREGIRIYTLAAPLRILEKDGHVAGVECVVMRLGSYDASGRRRPVPVEGQGFVLEADTVITSLGSAQDMEDLVLNEGIRLGNGKEILVDKDTYMTSVPGVFAGGDCVRGRGLVITAIADGKKAAQKIDQHLGGTNYKQADKRDIQRRCYQEVITEKSRRIQPRKLTPQERVNNFKEIEQRYTATEAKAEASRCLRCDVK